MLAVQSCPVLSDSVHIYCSCTISFNVLYSAWHRPGFCLPIMILAALFPFTSDHSGHNCLFQWVWADDMPKINKVEFWCCLSSGCRCSRTCFFVTFEVQGMHKRLLQHVSWNKLIFLLFFTCPTFPIIQLSAPYIGWKAPKYKIMHQ